MYLAMLYVTLVVDYTREVARTWFALPLHVFSYEFVELGSYLEYNVPTKRHD
jgi:hypothetical protein